MRGLHLWIVIVGKPNWAMRVEIGKTSINDEVLAPRFARPLAYPLA
jgi:hypothetical protein